MEVTCRINYDRGTADAMSHGPISFIRRGTGPRRSSCNFEDCAAAHDDDRQWHRRAIDFRFRLETAASKINDVSWLVSRSVSNESAGESPTWSPRNLATETEKKWKTIGRGRAIVHDVPRSESVALPPLVYTYSRTQACTNNRILETHNRSPSCSRKLLWQKFPLRLGVNLDRFNLILLPYARPGITHLNVCETYVHMRPYACVLRARAIFRSDKSLKLLTLSSKPRQLQWREWRRRLIAHSLFSFPKERATRRTRRNGRREADTVRVV